MSAYSFAVTRFVINQ